LASKAGPGLVVLDQRATRVKRTRQLFFHPLELHFQAPDLLIKLVECGPGFAGLFPTATILKDFFQTIDGSTFPLVDLSRMNRELLGDFAARLPFPNCL
jgi:hypothetical protein